MSFRKIRFLFLDIDGVLNTEYDWKTNYILRPEKIKLLAEIVRKTGAEIILTSTWKTGYDKNSPAHSDPHILYLLQLFQKEGIQINGSTPDLKGRNRSKEIERFLYLNKTDDPYIILDDDESLFDNGIKTHGLFLVNSKTGLTPEDVKKIAKEKKYI